MECRGVVFGAKLTAQLVETAPVVESVLALPSVQLEAEKVPPLFVKLTVPVGAVAEPGVASVTVAVQLVAPPTGTEGGVQLTSVVRSGERRVGEEGRARG